MPKPSEVGKIKRLKFIAQKTEDGAVKGKIRFYCETLEVSWQAFYDYLKKRDKLWKTTELAENILKIIAEDECNDAYGRGHIHAALKLKYPNENIPSEHTVYHIMERIVVVHAPAENRMG